jgi:S1-C subfamily serine protease
MKKLLCIAILLMGVNLYANENVESSIVKIFTVSKIPNYFTPWNSNLNRSHGSGTIIQGNRILTNAHVVANETFIEVKRHGDTTRYEAKVEFISHQADLALLRVKDESFFDGTKSLEFDGLPKIQQEIAVYGFPMGGNSISVSTGIVSRIEHTRYVHSREQFLSIQIDAAVNPGSSGGPAISDGKIVGVVMQQISQSQSIGYIVPVGVIKHFLEDVADGKYDGFAHLGIDTQMMENNSLRSIYQMDKNTTGVLIIDISQKSSAYNYLKKGDVMLAIDGHTIQNDGTVEFRKHQFTSYQYYVDQKQLGESVTIDVLRDGEVLSLNVLLNSIADDNLLVNTIEHDVMPRYFIFGGYVFTPLTRNLLVNNRSALLNLRLAASKWATNEKDEEVLLLKVLATETNRGDHSFSLWMVDKVDGKSFKDFKEFLELVKSSENKYVVFENLDGVKVAVDKEEAMRIEETILKRYSIKSSQRI